MAPDFRPGIADAPADTLSATDKQAFVLAVESTFDTLFAWDYAQGRRQGIDTLYKKAKQAQWDPDYDLDWSVGGQIDRARDPRYSTNQLAGVPEAIFSRLNAAERARLAHANLAWTLSQFLHVEQGAMACAAKLVQTAPWVDAKFYAASQVMDEARHMEVFGRYVRDKLEWLFPVNTDLERLLKGVVSDSRWDFTFLGMQVVIEGLALAAFGLQYQSTPDPLLMQITRYVVADEARHVAERGGAARAPGILL